MGFFYYNLIRSRIAGDMPACHEVVGLKILIADDQSEVRYALRGLIEQENDLFEVDEACDMDSLLSRIRDGKPDLILLDWELSNRGMADVVARIRRLMPGISIIALSSRPEAEKSAAAAGADAFVSKGDNSDRLLSAIYSLR
jgi:two-component system invasion response regulator UvrY